MVYSRLILSLVTFFYVITFNNSVYSQSESTRGEVNQSNLVTGDLISLSVTSAIVPTEIPPEGGILYIDIRLYNDDDKVRRVDLWNAMLMPDDSLTGPLRGPERAGGRSRYASSAGGRQPLTMWPSRFHQTRPFAESR